MNSNLPDDDLRENPAIRDRRGAIGLLLAALALVGGATGTGSASARQSRKRCPTRRRCGKRCCTRGQVCLSAGGGKRCVAAAGTCADAGTQTCNDNIDCACVVSVEGALRCGQVPAFPAACAATADCAVQGTDAFCADRSPRGAVCFRQCVGTTPPEGTCTAGDGRICNGNDRCRCFETTEGAIRCGQPAVAFVCTGSATCTIEFGDAGAFCAANQDGPLGFCATPCRAGL